MSPLTSGSKIELGWNSTLTYKFLGTFWKKSCNLYISINPCDFTGSNKTLWDSLFYFLIEHTWNFMRKSQVKICGKTPWQILRFTLISILSSQTPSYIPNAVNKFSKSSSLQKISWFRVRILIPEHRVTRDGKTFCSNQLALMESQMTSIYLLFSYACLNQSPQQFLSSAPEMSEARRTSTIFSLLFFTFPAQVFLICPWFGQAVKLCLTLTFPAHLEGIPFLWAPFTETSPYVSWPCTLQISHSCAGRAFPKLEERSHGYN